MAAALLLLAALLFRPCLWADDSKDQGPSFTPDSIVNNANRSPASLAPNTIATIYGTNLAFSTAGVTGETAAPLPPRAVGRQGGVGGELAPPFYVSPTPRQFAGPAR